MHKIHGTFTNCGLPIRVEIRQADGPPQNLDREEHTHDFTELWVVFSGSGVHRVNGHDYPIAAGHVFVLRPGDCHSFLERRQLRFGRLAFAGEKIPLPSEILERLSGYRALFSAQSCGDFSGYLQISSESLTKISHRFAAMSQEQTEQNEGFEILLLSGLLDVMALLSREFVRCSPRDPRALTRLETVIRALESDYGHDWKLEEICRLAFMSKTRLAVQFRQATGQSPIEFLMHLRLREAMKRLRESDLPVAHVAREVGFPNSSYFTRQFNRALGLTPLAYRKLAC